MAQCVFCSKTDTLNTSMTITLNDGNKVQVDICDQHAEEATIKSCREAYNTKQDQIAELLAQAKALGLNISETSGGLTLAEQAPAPVVAPPTDVPVAQQVQPKNKSLLNENDPDIVDTSKLDQINSRGMQSVGGSVDGGGYVEAHSSLSSSNLTDKLPEEVTQGKAKMAMVEGREGQPLAIPKMRVDGTGTTRISINKSEDDAKLQERFKRMSEDSRNNQVPNFARAGYQNTQRDCPFCRGAMEINGDECPKCKGAGVISVY